MCFFLQIPRVPLHQIAIVGNLLAHFEESLEVKSC